ncbi:terpene synthase family protein [Polyangium aurulentum]|uniref:terpene synthase family protein n=1 Tax=Polyangium aurulentum TaxID=2567896 RepID=UPI0010AE87D7|nr:hypothetical protein [Polyangium aurulentum]UQA63363.1 hypothetical protein E8A73_024005 [Polyangium aurulentum]
MTHQIFQADTGLFYCPLPSAVHPDVAEITRRSIEWMTRIGLCADERRRRRLVATNSAEFFCRMAPEGAEDRVQIGADWCYWGFAFDDFWSDKSQEGARPGDFIPLVARMLRLIETLDARLCDGDPYLMALHDIALRFYQCATPAQHRRWIEAQRQWLFGVVQRSSFEARGRMPALDGYVTMRLHDCGAAPVTVMVEIANGDEVPDHEMESPVVRALTEVTWMLGAIDNERVSRAKEIHGEGQEHSFVDVLAHERGHTPEQALHDVVAMRDRMMCLFLRLREQAMHQASPALTRHITDLGHVIRGHIEWSLNTTRYSTVYGAGESPIGTVDLSSGWASAPADDRLEPPPIPSIAWWWDQLA